MLPPVGRPEGTSKHNGPPAGESRTRLWAEWANFDQVVHSCGHVYLTYMWFGEVTMLYIRRLLFCNLGLDTSNAHSLNCYACVCNTTSKQFGNGFPPLERRPSSDFPWGF